ncbi:MAG: hypothetical protein PVSMB1_04550 [Gemmatimonadaceae bacterium]
MTALNQMRVMSSGVATLLIASVLWGVGIGGFVQRGLWWMPGSDPAVHNVPYDARVTFARLRYTSGPGGYYYHGLPAWAHGYAEAEHNLMKILEGLTDIKKPHVEESNVFALDDPDLCRFPIAYMTEAGYWTLTDKEATAFRGYLLKGGFVIFDDFRDLPRGGGGWENFEANMKRVLPEGRFVDLDPTLPIFHSFFEINSFDIVPQAYDRGRPVFRGVFEGNDRRKRLMAIANFNTDVSEYWEFSPTGLRPIEEWNDAYKLGVNYILYGMTH